jgi:hypothetical protein
MMGNGVEVVSGWKKVRLDPWHKVWPSWVFNGLVSWLTGVKLHDHNCGMKCYRAEIFREVRPLRRAAPLHPGAGGARGFSVGELAINHRPRKFGHSKYGVRRFVKGFLDLLTVKFLTSFRRRPQHLLGTIGLLSFLAGGLGIAWLAVEWVLTQTGISIFPPLHQRPLLIYAVAAADGHAVDVDRLPGGVNQRHTRDQDTYSIAERPTSALLLTDEDSRQPCGSPTDSTRPSP